MANNEPTKPSDKKAFIALTILLGGALRMFKEQFPGYNLLDFQATMITPELDTFPFRADKKSEQERMQHG